MRQRRAGLAFIFVTVFIDMLGVGIVFPILPSLLASMLGGDVRAAAQYYGYFTAVFAAMQFIFAPILGSLSDQFGRRSVLLLSLFGAGIDYMLLALAPNLWLLFVGRVIAGVTAASFTAANAYIADISLPEQRAQNFGIIGAAFGLGFIVGPLIGGLLGGFGPRVPFVVAGIFTLINWLYGFFVLPESLAPELRRPFSWRAANPLASLNSLGRHPIVLRLAAVIACSSIAQQGLIAVWVVYTTYRYGWDSWQQGLSLAMVGVTSVIVQAWLIRLIMPRLGERRALLVALGFSLVGFVLYGLATQGWMMYAILVITMLSAIGQPAAQGIISNSVAADEQGAVQGALASLLSVTAIIGPVLATESFTFFTAPNRTLQIPGAPFFLGAVLILLSVALAAWTFRRRPAQAVAAD